MDSSDPLIKFDEDGKCNHCSEFINSRIKHKYQGEQSDKELNTLIGQMKTAGRGKKYDCVLGLSGGVDSSYAAYLLKSKGLRVLAVHLDNGWNSEEAVSNIKNIADKLGISYESHVLNYHEFKEIQLAFLRASIPEAETPTDMAIQAAVHKTAAKYNIKYIISGGNFATEGILPASWHYNAKDTRYFNHITKKFSAFKIKNFPVFGYKQETYYKLARGIKIIYILNHVPYIKDEVQAFLEKELDWKYYGGKHRESKYTNFVQSFYLFHKFNIDYRRATLSTQICTGEIEREFAKSELEKKPYTEDELTHSKHYISKKLGISKAELETIIELPPKWYWDYPNDEEKLRFIYNTYRKLYNKEKLGSF